MNGDENRLDQTENQYREALESCRRIFLDKTRDYGTAWRVLRPISIADQIFIKARRIRNIQELPSRRVAETPAEELRAIVNYGIIALIQGSLDPEDQLDLKPEQALSMYDAAAAGIQRLMKDKNHDYGEAWREMSQQSFVDLVLMKLVRIRQILANGGKTIASEGISSNFEDIVNYALFALIRLQESGPRPQATSR
ncbi:MAG TPA: DUF1599 domain-containing protein [Chitinophagaceae bacterium]|nr:DUF1599 domain-containing protein [Chitinophagaceae bacterium]